MFWGGILIRHSPDSIGHVCDTLFRRERRVGPLQACKFQSRLYSNSRTNSFNSLGFCMSADLVSSAPSSQLQQKRHRVIVVVSELAYDLFAAARARAARAAVAVQGLSVRVCSESAGLLERHNVPGGGTRAAAVTLHFDGCVMVLLKSVCGL